MPSDPLEEFRREGPSWDALRERRLLLGSQRRYRERRQKRVTRARVVLFAAPICGALLVLAFGYVLGFRSGRRSVEQQPVAVTEQRLAPLAERAPGADFEVARVETLADGSRLELSEAAKIDFESEAAVGVRLAQQSGTVRYQVTRSAERKFVVKAGYLEISVVGTIFVVAIADDRVTVQVTQGQVRVTGPEGPIDLRAGDELMRPLTPPKPASQTPLAEPAPKKPKPPSANPGAPTADELFARSDTERQRRNLAGAAAALEQFLRLYPRDPRAALAWFSLGKVERARSRPLAAAAAFRQSRGPLAEDALAEEAAALDEAKSARARSVAARYLKQYPRGTHTARMRRVLE